MTIDDVCAEGGVSKGAFYGYFENKQALLLALLEDDAAEIDHFIDTLSAERISNGERIRRFTRRVLEQGDDPARVQLKADLWSAILGQAEVREQFVRSVRRRRELLRGWVEAGISSGELVDVPANAFASLLLALSDGLLLQSALDPSAFRWPRIRTSLDVLLRGVEKR